jgi:hypothetical protein
MAVIAVMAGVRAGICMMPLATWIFSVRAAIHASGVIASEPYASAVQTEWKAEPVGLRDEVHVEAHACAGVADVQAESHRARLGGGGRCVNRDASGHAPPRGATTCRETAVAPSATHCWRNVASFHRRARHEACSRRFRSQHTDVSAIGGSEQPPSLHASQAVGNRLAAAVAGATWKPAAKHISGNTSAQMAFGGRPT